MISGINNNADWPSDVALIEQQEPQSPQTQAIDVAQISYKKTEFDPAVDVSSL